MAINPSEVVVDSAPASPRPAGPPAPRINPAEVQVSSINPADVQVDDYRQRAAHIISATPGLDKKGQMAVMAREQEKDIGPLITPAYGEQVNQNLTMAQRLGEYGVSGLKGFASAGLAPFRAVANGPINDIIHGASGAIGELAGQNPADDALYDYQPASVGNTIARGVGAAVPMAATGLASGGSVGALTLLGGVSGVGGARESGADWQTAAGHGVVGALTGAAQGRLLGGVGRYTGQIQSPLLRTAAAAGGEIAGNAAFGAGGQIAGNVIDDRPVFENVGQAALEGAAGGLAFAPLGAMHAHAAHNAAVAGHIGDVTGASDVSIAAAPQGRAALAAKYIGDAVGRKVVWFDSDSPVQAFPDADGKTIYANARSPQGALPAILAHEAIGHVAKDPAVAAELEGLRRQYPQAQATAEQEYLADLEAGGFGAKAQQLRGNPLQLREEGTAKFIEEAIKGNGDLVDDIAARYPGLFARVGRSVAETMDRLTGGNKTKARLVREQLGLVGDVFANAEQASRAMATRQATGEEAMLDRLDPQLTDAARDNQAARAQRSAELADDGRQRLAARDILDEERQTREEDAEADRRVAQQRARAPQEAAAAAEAGRVNQMTDRQIYEEAQRRGMRIEPSLRAPDGDGPAPDGRNARTTGEIIPPKSGESAQPAAVSGEGGLTPGPKSEISPAPPAQEKAALSGGSSSTPETSSGAEQLTAPKRRYTSIPRVWVGQQLNSWNGADVGLPKGKQLMASDGYRRRYMTQGMLAELERVPNASKSLLGELAGMTDEVWPVKGKQGGYALAPRQAVEIATSRLKARGVDPEMEVIEAGRRRDEARQKWRASQADRERKIGGVADELRREFVMASGRYERGGQVEAADPKNQATLGDALAWGKEQPRDSRGYLLAYLHGKAKGDPRGTTYQWVDPTNFEPGTEIHIGKETLIVDEDPDTGEVMLHDGVTIKLNPDAYNRIPARAVTSPAEPESKEVNDTFTSEPPKPEKPSEPPKPEKPKPTFYEPPPRPVDESKTMFGGFAPQKNTGTQGKMVYETEPAKVPIKQPEETAGDARARKVNGGDKTQAAMFAADENIPLPNATGRGTVDATAADETPAPPDSAAAPAGPTVGAEKVKDGRTSIEVSAGNSKLTVEQERPGSKTWRVVRKGQTIGEVSRATRQTLAGGMTREEAIAEASARLGKSKPTPPPASEPQSLRDLPDEEIPFSIAPRKEGEEDKPVRPALRTAAAAVVSTARDVRRYLSIHPVPRLTEAGVGDAAVEHASAKIATPKIVDDLIAKVLPDSFGDEKATAHLADILLKNRYLGAYDRMGRIMTDFAAKAHEATPGRSDELAARALEARNRRDAIARAHPLAKYEADVVAALQDPDTRAAIDRYQEHVSDWLDALYQEVKGAGEEPSFKAPKQGRHFDAYLPIIGEIEGPEAARVQNADEFLPPNNTMNAKVRKDRFDRRADYTGTFDTDLHALLSAVVGPRWNEATKLRFYKSLLASGAAVEASKDIDRPAELQGKPVAALDVKMPRFDPETGQTTHPDRKIFLRADLHREVRDALDTDQRSPQSPLAKALTTVQLFQLADAITHAKNIASRVYMSQGAGSRLFDVVKANPAVGIPRTVAKLLGAWREVSADGPEIRREVADMAKAGMIRGKFERVGILDKIADRTGWEWVKKLSTGDMLHSMDTAARVILNRQYSELVAQGRAEDSTTSRRNFVNTVGQYNHRLMGPLMKSMRDAGISPFVVAGRTYNQNAIDTVVGNPGFAAPTKAAQRSARLTQLGMLAAIAMTAPLVNMITTGTPGGRSGTPLGAIDLGGDDTDGEGEGHKVWDVLQIAGLRRGLRATGLDALGEGLSQGKDANTIGGNAFIGAGQAALHPWLGPAVGFGFKALTGRQLDIRGKMEAATIPEGGAKQYLENFRAAVESQNPLVYALTRPAFQAAGLDQKPQDEESGYVSGILGTAAKSPLGAAGVKDVRPGKDAGEELADRLAKLRFGNASMTPEDAGKFALRQQLTAGLKADPQAGAAAIEQAVEDGKLSEQQAANIHRKAGMSPFAWNVRSLSGADAAKVYAAASDEEKEQIRGLVTDKLIASKDLSPQQQDETLEELGIDAPPDLALRRELHALSAKARAYDAAKKKVTAGDRAARGDLQRNRLSEAEQARLKRLQTIGRAVKKAGGDTAKIRRLVTAA